MQKYPMNTREHNGLSTQDTSRIQGQGPFQEGQVARYNLQQQASAGLRSDDGEKDRIIYIENLSEHRAPFVIRKAKIVQDILEGVYKKIPRLRDTNVEVRIFGSRFGSPNTVRFHHDIPSKYEVLYIRLYVIKK